MNPAPVIHQFAPTVAPGDGVTNAVLYTRELLRELGCLSDIFSHRPPFELRDIATDIHRFDHRACDLLLVHHSMGHDLDRWLAGLGCPKVLVYHNITPVEYFPEGSGHHYYARRGLEQLLDLPALRVRRWWIARDLVGIRPVGRSRAGVGRRWIEGGVGR